MILWDGTSDRIIISDKRSIFILQWDSFYERKIVIKTKEQKLYLSCWRTFSAHWDHSVEDIWSRIWRNLPWYIRGGMESEGDSPHRKQRCSNSWMKLIPWGCFISNARTRTVAFLLAPVKVFVIMTRCFISVAALTLFRTRAPAQGQRYGQGWRPKDRI